MGKATAISQDGRWMVNGSSGHAKVTDLASSSPAANSRKLSGDPGFVDRVAISNDNRWVVTGNTSGTTRVWDLDSENPSTNPLVLGYDDNQQVIYVGFSADNRIVTGTLYGNSHIRAWRWQWNDLEELARQVGRNFTREEWSRYFPGEPYRKTFSDLPVSGEAVPAPEFLGPAFTAPPEPTTAVEFLKRASKRHAGNQVDEAVEDLTKAIRLDQDLTTAYGFRGLIYARKRASAKAAEDFGRAYELAPASAYYAQLWSYLLYDSQNVDAHRAACARVRESLSKSENPSDIQVLCRILMLRPGTIDDPEFLVQQAQRAMTRWPTDWWSHHVLAGALIRNQQYAEALSVLDELDQKKLASTSSDAGPWLSPLLNNHLRVIALVKLGRHDEAKTVLEKAKPDFDKRVKTTRDLPFGEFTSHWWNWYPAHAFRREAEELLLEAQKAK